MPHPDPTEALNAVLRKARMELGSYTHLKFQVLFDKELVEHLSNLLLEYAGAQTTEDFSFPDLMRECRPELDKLAAACSEVADIVFDYTVEHSKPATEA